MKTELTFEQKQDIGLKFVMDALEPVSPYGAGLLKKPRFYAPGERRELELELWNVELMLRDMRSRQDAVQRLRHALSALKDVTGSLRNCALGQLSEVELFELTAFSLRMRELIPLAQALPCYNELSGAALESVEGALAVLDPTGSGRLSFFVEDARTPELLSLRRRKRALEKMLREPDCDRDRIAAERLAVSRDEERELLSIYRAMSDALRPMLPLLEKNAAAAGRLDAVICKALLARRFGGVRPEIGGETLRLKGARSPEIERALSDENRDFTPITAELPRGVTVLTGANMGGKSVAIKTMALNIALALSGFFVFCEEAEVPAFDRVELINRDFSSATGGLSSFGGEIMRFNEAAARLKEGGLSFIAMDEFARGTNAEEGAAIARGVVKYLERKNAVTILATHYDGTALFASRHYQVRGLRDMTEDIPRPREAGEGVRLISERMDYGLVRVDRDADCPRDALRICRILGMDEEILNEIG